MERTEERKGGQNMQSMDEVYRAHSKSVYLYLLSLTHNTQVSEELTQETFYQAVKSIQRYDENCKITTWLCGIAKNVLHEYKRKHRETEEINPETISSPSAEAEVLNKVSQIDILRKLQIFHGDVREVMYLRLLGDLSFKEIGDVLSKSENWARVTYYRGKEKLKKEISNDR